MTSTQQRFSPLQRVLHWIMAICILSMLFIGVGMVSTIRPDHLTLVSIHEPLGIAIFVLAVFRLVARFVYGAPSLPAGMPESMKIAAHLSHWAFYALMLGLPLLGYGMLAAADYPVVAVGIQLPSILPHSNALHALLWSAHKYLALCFFVLILVHFSAALFHAMVRRDGVFRTMAPWR
ncbi:cytochrome b [Paraburkholderia sp. BCC1884]|uniref:cytochrome b n=1 Tax=Paraburkholderia sp. BCC1884 TaxID=2562668 RepID=UPI0011844027|nr:cytochrome b [Paraburkholderia sp. BCC1884]